MRKDKLLESLYNRLNIKIAASKRANAIATLSTDPKEKHESEKEAMRAFGSVEAIREIIQEVEKL